MPKSLHLESLQDGFLGSSPYPRSDLVVLSWDPRRHISNRLLSGTGTALRHCGGSIRSVLPGDISCRVSDPDAHGEDTESGSLKLSSVRSTPPGVAIDLCIGPVR